MRLLVNVAFSGGPQPEMVKRFGVSMKASCRGRRFVLVLRKYCGWGFSFWSYWQSNMLARIVRANIHGAAFSWGPHPETMQRIGGFMHASRRGYSTVQDLQKFPGWASPFWSYWDSNMVDRTARAQIRRKVLSPTRYNGKKFRLKIGPVESNKHRI